MKRIKSLMAWAYDNNYVFYYISFLSLVFSKMLGFYSGDMEYKIIMAFSMICLGFKYVFTKYTKKELILIATAIIYAVFIFLKTGYVTFTISVLIVGGLKGIDVKHLLSKTVFIRIVCMAVLVSASTAGIVGNFVRDQYEDGLTYSFGYTNPNDFMVNLYITVALIFFLDYKKLNILHFGLSVYAFYAVYCVTNSTTGFLLGIFLVIVFLCLKVFDNIGRVGEKMKQLISMLLIPSSLYCFIITFISSVLFDEGNKIWFTIDQLITGRLKIQNMYWIKYGFSILGKDISEAAARYDGVQINNGFLDNNYWCSFYKYGFVTELFFIACLIFTAFYFYRKKNYNAVILMGTLCVYGLTEDFLISAVVNPFLILMGCAFFRNDAKEESLKIEEGKLPAVSHQIVKEIAD